MCFIGGCVVHEQASPFAAVEDTLKGLLRVGQARGKDGAGYAVFGDGVSGERELKDPGKLADAFRLSPGSRIVLLASRLEPTSEYLPDPQKTDIQPYTYDGITVIHNGIIANDSDLRESYGIARSDLVSTVDSALLPNLFRRLGGLNSASLQRFATDVAGSYAIAAYDDSQPDRIYLACSYKPLWTAYVPELGATFFASEEEFLKSSIDRAYNARIDRLAPYSGQWLDTRKNMERFDLDYRPRGNTALCVCSGGMDSTTAAAMVRSRGEDIVFCHFLYGCKAEQRERRAVEEIARHYQTKAFFVPIPWLRDLGGSSLTSDDKPIADGNLGVETAHEWVPARNLLLVAHAVALCERHGYGRIVLGTNEQEGEVFPDNEMEFIANLQKAVTIGSPVNIRLEAPLDRMSKRDIVKIALALDVPLDKTWSCYRSGDSPCGTCGSCLQRRVAFLQLGLEDFISYEQEVPPEVLAAEKQLQEKA